MEKVTWADIALYIQKVLEARGAQNFRRRVDDVEFMREFLNRRDSIEKAVKAQYGITHLSEHSNEFAFVCSEVVEMFVSLRSYVRSIYDILDVAPERAVA